MTPGLPAQIFKIDGFILTGIERSAASVIKTEAVNLARTSSSFEDLNDVQNNTVSLGLNSIIDLSNADGSKGSQKSFFNADAWQELPPLPDFIQDKPKQIGKPAITNKQAAYQLSLHFQAKYALSYDEMYFEVYAHMYVLFQQQSILSTHQSKCAAEQDYVGEVWTPIFSTISNDEELDLKWGDSVSEESTTAKKWLLPNNTRRVIGDRIDMQIAATIDEQMFDVMNGEFASVLREAKLILDSIIKPGTATSEVRPLLVPCFQASGLNGEIIILKLAAPGLYTAQYIGSICIPDDVGHLSDLHKKIPTETLVYEGKLHSTAYTSFSSI
ncbi:hypothetical protein DFQ29_002147 [Apophysomyces sp. BC1021]|nr:hypothetical protein DFQ29_002147 [Apophysomyces sp. BC1021]